MTGYAAIRRFVEDESGASAVEYGMVVTILSLSLLGILGTGSTLGSLYDTVVVKIAQALSN